MYEMKTILYITHEHFSVVKHIVDPVCQILKEKLAELVA